MENSNIRIAERQEPSNPSHIGNPLLEALFDLLTPEEFFKILHENQTLLTRKEILELSPEIRPQYLNSIRVNFLIPNKRLYEVYELIHSSINTSYSLRNPLKNSIRKNLQQDYRNFTALLEENFVSTFSNSSMIFGVSGIGKTTGVNFASALFPSALRHVDSELESFVQIPIVKIECPKDGSIKDLCRYFFIELDRILGRRKYELEYCKPRDNASDRVVAMSKLVAAHCIGILIVDEIQHLSMAKSGGAELMLNFFLNLDNTLHIPIIVVGTPEAIELFSEKQRLRRRFSAGGSLKWDRLPQDKEWEIIIKQLLKYQYTDELANSSVNWNDIFYYHSQGIIDRAIKIFIAAQKLAFEINAKAITHEIINEVVHESMWLDEDTFKDIREGKLNLNSATDLFLPTEKASKKENYRMVNIQNQLLDFEVPENFSFPLIEDLIKENPVFSDSEIAFKILKEYNLQELQGVHKKLEKGSKKLNKNFIAGDLRKCMAEDTTSLYEQLEDLDVIAELEDYMI